MLSFCSEISSLKNLATGLAAIQPTYLFKIKKDYPPLFLKDKSFRVGDVGFFILNVTLLSFPLIFLN